MQIAKGALTTESNLKLRCGPSGLHIFFRKTGYNVLCDEIQIPSNLWAQSPRQISVALTNACDLACSYCYASKIPGILDEQKLVDWLAELDCNGCLGVGFGGGEPTLYPGFSQLCRRISATTGLAVTFTTHGHHLSSSLANQLRGYVHFIRVSVDGIGGTYERLRKRSFSSLRDHLEIVRNLAPFGINFVVNADTLPDLDAAISFAAEMGASEFLLLPEQPVKGRGGIDSGTTGALRDWIGAYEGRVPLTISEVSTEGILTIPAVAGETGLRAYAHIDAHGVLKRSSYDRSGIAIDGIGVMNALRQLEDQGEHGHEDLVGLQF